MKLAFSRSRGRIALSALLVVCILALASCASFSKSGAIDVIARGPGSGLRAELMVQLGLSDAVNGTGQDSLSSTAKQYDTTADLINAVKRDSQSIGFVAATSLDSGVKALTVGGVAANADNVLAQTYPLSVPFILVTSQNMTSTLRDDFLTFISSNQGGAVIREFGCNPAAVGTSDYTNTDMTGHIIVEGSTAMQPLMQKLVDAYKKINPHVQIDVNGSDSTQGITDATSGVCDIGMSSRDLTSDETAGMDTVTIGSDAIAVIVNKANPLDDITTAQLAAIFSGTTATWNSVN